MSSNEDLIERLRKQAEIEPKALARFLREAAAALSAGCQHVPLVTSEGEWVRCLYDGVLAASNRHYDRHHFGKGQFANPCPGPHKTLHVEAEQTKQETSEQ